MDRQVANYIFIRKKGRERRKMFISFSTRMAQRIKALEKNAIADLIHLSSCQAYFVFRGNLDIFHARNGPTLMHCVAQLVLSLNDKPRQHLNRIPISLLWIERVLFFRTVCPRKRTMFSKR